MFRAPHEPANVPDELVASSCLQPCHQFAKHALSPPQPCRPCIRSQENANTPDELVVFQRERMLPSLEAATVQAELQWQGAAPRLPQKIAAPNVRDSVQGWYLFVSPEGFKHALPALPDRCRGGMPPACTARPWPQRRGLLLALPDRCRAGCPPSLQPLHRP